MNDVLSVFGLGKLGCTMLACFAHKGWQVIGVDINKDFVDRINAGESPIYEPGVADLIKNNKERILATTDPKTALEKSLVSFVIVPTPSLKDGSFSTEYVEKAVTVIASAMRRTEDPYRVIVITSTVLPGDMNRINQVIENVSGKKCGVDYGLCYNPDFIALGKVVHDFLNPDMILIGESDPKAGKIVEDIHRNLIDKRSPVHRMNWWNAELAKITLNTYCVMKINFANMIGEICEQIPGGNARTVLTAVGDDTRIGRKYFMPGLSSGGPCFPRDARAFIQAADRFDVKVPLATTIDEFNNYNKTHRIPTLVMGLLREKNTDKLSVLGLTYKENTTLVEESASITMIKILCRQNVNIKIYDPAGMDEARKALEGSPVVTFCETIDECLRDNEVCFIGTSWQEFKKLTAEDFSVMKNPTILDAWNLYDFNKHDGIDYRVIGRNSKGVDA